MCTYLLVDSLTKKYLVDLFRCEGTKNVVGGHGKYVLKSACVFLRERNGINITMAWSLDDICFIYVPVSDRQ